MRAENSVHWGPIRLQSTSTPTSWAIYNVCTHFVQDLGPTYGLFLIRTVTFIRSFTWSFCQWWPNWWPQCDIISLCFLACAYSHSCLCLLPCRCTFVKLMACWNSWESRLQNSLTSQFSWQWKCWDQMSTKQPGKRIWDADHLRRKANTLQTTVSHRLTQVTSVRVCCVSLVYVFV